MIYALQLFFVGKLNLLYGHVTFDTMFQHMSISLSFFCGKDDTYTNLFQNIVIVISIFNTVNIETITKQNTHINTKFYIYNISTKI